MYQRLVLGLVEAQDALRAVWEDAAKEPDRPVAVAIVDRDGELICYCRMDGTSPIARRLAIRKAYTSGRAGADSAAFAERLGRVNLPVGEVDPEFVGARGGVCIEKDGAMLGGIGVSGRSGEEDEALARLGLSILV
jgi:uncharacterized protein GlcG (DUF336 family)